jgi:prohibitin 1
MTQQNQVDPKKIRIYVTLGIAVVALIIFVKSTFIILQPTERGVVFKKYTSGLDVENVRQEGLNIIAPWNDLIKFDIAQHDIAESMDVLSSDGLNINLDVSIRYRPDPSMIGNIYNSFKTNYEKDFIRPEFRSAVRRIIGQHSAEELYGKTRQVVEDKVRDEIEEKFSKNHIELKSIMFRSTKLPDKLRESIEAKLSADQDSKKREYYKEIAEKDAKIQIIEAKGKAESNRILSASLTDKILQEKGIQATMELTKSNNSKIIVIGGGKDGLPIILNPEK